MLIIGNVKCVLANSGDHAWERTRLTRATKNNFRHVSVRLRSTNDDNWWLTFLEKNLVSWHH